MKRAAPRQSKHSGTDLLGRRSPAPTAKQKKASLSSKRSSSASGIAVRTKVSVAVEQVRHSSAGIQ